MTAPTIDLAAIERHKGCTGIRCAVNGGSWTECVKHDRLAVATDTKMYDELLRLAKIGEKTERFHAEADDICATEEFLNDSGGYDDLLCEPFHAFAADHAACPICIDQWYFRPSQKGIEAEIQGLRRAATGEVVVRYGTLAALLRAWDEREMQRADEFHERRILGGEGK
jgi:hypothetical protein